jgi:DNA-binding transcriptional LysR family regulator
MDLRQLEHFVAAAEELQFTRAARRVHVVQSTLSASIRALEREFGVVLFLRTTRRVALTDAGRAFAADARRVLAAAAEARDGLQQAQGTLRGQLSIGTGQYVGGLDVPELLAAFCAEHPSIEVRLRQDAASVLADEVRDGSLDVVLAAQPAVVPADLTVTPLGSAPMVLACAPGHRLSRRRLVRLEELEDETFVDFPPGWASRLTVDSAFRTLRIPRRVALEANDIIGLLNLVSHDLGIAIVPGGFAAIPADVRFARIAKPPVMRYAAMTRRGSPVSVVSQRFLEVALARIGHEPSAPRVAAGADTASG